MLLKNSILPAVLSVLLLAADWCAAATPERMKTPGPSLAVGAAFDSDDRLWRAKVVADHVEVSYSVDHGKTFSAPVRVNSVPERVSADGENRPKISASGAHVYVSWTQPLSQPFAGHVRFAHSEDGGKTFFPPRTVNTDLATTSHRFDALLADAAGRVTLAWLDKRDLEAARGEGRSYRGAAVYLAQSGDHGRTFAPNRKLADHSCECCRIGLAADVDGTPVAFWRHVFDGGVRDFALARLDEAPRRASEDGWRIDACPHHGGDLAIDGRGGRHLVWFTGAENKAGLYYRRIDGGQATAPLAFGDPDAQAGHPAVLALGERVLVAWREFDGRQNRIRVMTSADRGASWSAARTPAATAGAADYPLLLSGRGQMWLAWNTADEGFRLFALGAGE